MPKYSYSCDKCKNKFDIKATIREKTANSRNLFHCPKCKSSEIRQLFNTVRIGSSSSSDLPCGAESCSTGRCPFMK